MVNRRGKEFVCPVVNGTSHFDFRECDDDAPRILNLDTKNR